MMISDLPLELESEILSRVPATSLAQLRFTCKRWYALFKDPRFIQKNLEMGKASATHVVFKKNESVYSFTIDLSRINNIYEQFIQFRGKLRSQDVKISKIFRCEGLFLCKTKKKELVVWNPCTRQTRCVIPSTVLSSKQYFLGYENKKWCRSYKILSFSCHLNDQKDTIAEFEMYEFDSDSWRVLDVVVTRSFWDFCYGLGVSLKGNTYWLDSELVGDKIPDNFIRRFDFTTESFGRLPLPFESDDYDLVSVLSVFRDEKLAVSYQDFYEFSFELKIWMTNNTKTEEFSWSLFLVVDFLKLELKGMTRVMSFLVVDEENKRVMCCDDSIVIEEGDRTRIYIAGEDMCKEVYRERTNETEFDSQLLLSYVPSLVHIPARQSNPCGKRKRRPWR